MGKSADNSTVKAPPVTGKAVLSGLVAFLIPGAGHLMLGKYLRSIVFFLSSMMLAVTGLLLHGEMHSLLRDNAWEGFLQLMAGIGNIGLGIVHLFFYLFGLGTGDVTVRTYEVGTTFIIIAALINVLVALDAFDIARGVKK